MTSIRRPSTRALRMIEASVNANPSVDKFAAWFTCSSMAHHQIYYLSPWQTLQCRSVIISLNNVPWSAVTVRSARYGILCREACRSLHRHRVNVCLLKSWHKNRPVIFSLAVRSSRRSPYFAPVLRVTTYFLFPRIGDQVCNKQRDEVLIGAHEDRSAT